MNVPRSSHRILLGLVCAAAVLVPAAPAAAAVVHRELDYDLGSPSASADANRLDLYLPAEAKPRDSRPVVVYVHGGGWRSGDKANRIADKAALFTGAGYVFASINYRLSPEDVLALAPGRVMFPDHPADVGEALGWLDRNVGAYGGDRRRIALIGHSAGAHLVALVSTDPRYVRAHEVEPWQLIGTVALDTEAFDVGARIAAGGPQARALLFNAFGTPAENAASDLWWPGSPIAWADRRDPRMLIVAQAANAGRIAESERLASALGQDPAASVLAVPYDHAQINDAVGGADDPAGETAAITGFLAEALRAAKAPRARLAKRPAKRLRLRGAKRKLRVRFRFRASADGARFECRLGSGRLRRCRRSPAFEVGAGRHRLRVRAIAAGGRPGPVLRYRFAVRPPPSA